MDGAGLIKEQALRKLHAKYGHINFKISARLFSETQSVIVVRNLETENGDFVVVKQFSMNPNSWEVLGEGWDNG